MAIFGSKFERVAFWVANINRRDLSVYSKSRALCGVIVIHAALFLTSHRCPFDLLTHRQTIFENKFRRIFLGPAACSLSLFLMNGLSSIHEECDWILFFSFDNPSTQLYQRDLKTRHTHAMREHVELDANTSFLLRL